nr:MAG: hypothetical protein [Penaeus semisulcatus pemonivirus]
MELATRIRKPDKSSSTIVVIDCDDQTCTLGRPTVHSSHTPKKAYRIQRSRSDIIGKVESPHSRPSNPGSPRSPILIRKTKSDTLIAPPSIVHEMKKNSVPDHPKWDRDKVPAVVVFDCNDHIGSEVLVPHQSKHTRTFPNPGSAFSLPRSASETFIMSSSRRTEDNALRSCSTAITPIIIRKSMCDPLQPTLLKERSRSSPLLPVITTNDERVSRTTVIPRRRKKKPIYPLLVQRKNPAIRGRKRRIATRADYRRSPVIQSEIDDEQSAAAPVSKRQTCVSLFAVAITLCLTAIGLLITQSLTHIIGGSECKCPPMPTCPL